MHVGIAFIVGALTLGGCAASQDSRQPNVAEAPAPPSEPQPKPGMAHGMGGRDMAATCPMAVEGTTARVEDVDGAAGMAFTTTGDVAELRRRVAHMAEMHDQHHGKNHDKAQDMVGAQPISGSTTMAGAEAAAPAPHAAGMHGGMHGDGKGMTGDGRKMPLSTARSENIEGGARLIVTPQDPADLAQLREHTHKHAEQMASGQCPMMSMHAHGNEAAPGEHESHHPKAGN